MAAHNLSQGQLNTLRSLHQQGHYADAWRQLAQWGDTYADDAANVTGEPSDFYGQFMNEMVRQHWGNTAGSTAYSQYFDAVALMHLNNYLLLLENTPNWPNSSQIEGSYRNSVEFYGLPASTAFDGVFTQSVGTITSGDYDWPHALGMDEARIVPSDVFDDIGFIEASQTLADTVYDTIVEFVEQGWGMLEDIVEFATDAVLDFLDEARKTALEKLKDFVDSVKDTVEDVYDAIKDMFDEAKNFIPRRDPLVLDLDGDGIETVPASGAVLFDHDGDGVRSGTGWISSDDGILVLDRNGNGLIDSGRELFGADTVLSDGSTATSGFAALADIDANDDGVFDAQDSQYNNVRVWRDLNQDGVSQANELFTLNQLGVASIQLTPSTTADLDLGNGNVVDNRGTYTRSDGSVGLAGDLLLAMDHYFRDFTGSLDPVEVEAEARSLPRLRGSGAVRDLVEAASLSSSLLSTLQGFAPGTTRDEMRGELDLVISLWAGTSTMQSSEQVLESSGSVPRTILFHGDVPASVVAQGQAAVEAWKQQQHAHLAPIIAILERFNGSSLITYQNDRVSTGGNTFTWTTVALPGGGNEQVMSIELRDEQIAALTSSYEELLESVYARLVLGTRLSAYIESIDTNFVGNDLHIDLSSFHALLESKRQDNLAEALKDLVDLYRYGGSILARADWDGQGLLRSWITEASATQSGLAALAAAGITLAQYGQSGTAGNDVLWGSGDGNTLWGGAGGDLLVGNDGGDTLYGQEGRDILSGGAGYDWLSGGAGDDQLAGGTENDSLTGGEGSDTYFYYLGDGWDTINNFDRSAGRFDVLVLGEGIAPAGVTVRRLGDSLIISVTGSSDQITVSNYFAADGAGGYQLDQIRFADGTVWTVDTLKPMVVIPTLGDDNLYGYATADVLTGLSGNDSLFGYGGNDVLQGGTGNDTLSGGEGSDTYIFNLGDGQDVIDGYDGSAGSFDVLQLGAGIAPEDVQAFRRGNSLVLMFANGTDQVTVNNYFLRDGAGGFQVDEIRFADGASWDVGEVKLRVQVATEGSDELHGYETNDTLGGLSGDDILNGHGGNDVLEGGLGNDTLTGGAGSDVYHFSAGDGQDVIDNYDTSAGRVDAIQLGAGIVPADVTARRQGDSLVLNFANGTDRITVTSYFVGDAAAGYQLDEIRFANGVVWNVATVMPLVQVPTAEADEIHGYAGSDALVGLGGNDLIRGNAGDDTLEGGLGNDNLAGGAGSDVYIFNAGDGQDVINNHDAGAGRTDSLRFGPGILTTNVLVRRTGDSLVLTFAGSDDRVTISNYFYNDAAGAWRLDEIRFDDGTIWDVTAVRQMALAPTSGNDVIQGYATNDSITGGEGNDTLHGYDGNDLLQGDEGDDVIFAGAGHDALEGGAGADSLRGDGGDDVLRGGLGNDFLDGGAGSDTYIFNVGDGQDTINNYDGGDGSVDVLVLGAGISPGNVVARRVDDSLVLTFVGSEDKITVLNFFMTDATAGYQLDQIRFQDVSQTVWDVETLKGLVLLPTSGADTLRGYATNDSFSGGEGNDTLFGFAGDDVLNGDAGSDVLWGGEGNDTLLGGIGLDTLNGDNGDDLLHGGAENDILRGGSGSDHLTGGAGNDQLEGGQGDDHYYFSAGDGQDTIADAQGTSTIHLSGIPHQQVYLRRDGTTLVLSFLGSPIDGIRLVGFFDQISQLALRGLVIDTGDGAPLALDADGVDAATLLGTDVDDVIEGNSLGNSIAGLSGSDTVRGGAGNDHLDGGAGNDSLYGQDGNDTLIGAEGDDLLDGGAGADHLSGGSGNDVYVVDNAGDVVVESANGGVDVVQSSVSFTLVDNVERLTLIGDADINANGNTLDNVLTGNGADNVLRGFSGNDVLSGGEGNDTLHGDAGEDHLDGGAGVDQLAGGTGNDVYRVDETGDVIVEHVSEGVDTVESTAYSYTLSANLESLTLVENSSAYEGIGNTEANVLTGNSNDNRLDGGAGADTLIGGFGNDIYVIDSTSDVIVENFDEGIDTVESSISYTLGSTLENLTLLGSADLSATGNDGDNVIQGNEGGNRIEGGDGADTLSGGAGDDYYVAISSDDSVHEYADEGIDTVERVFETNLVLDSNVENLILGAGVSTGNGNGLDNTITGNGENNTLGGWDGNDVLHGLDGDDALFGGDGADTLLGGIGNDYLDGGAGVDLLEGGAGNDVYITDDSGDVVVEAAGAGTDQVQTTASYTLSANIENLFLMEGGAIDGTGNSLDNYIAGNSDANVIDGGGGNDTLVAGGGDDTLYGGTGDDKYVFDESSGSDVIDNSDGGFDGVFFTGGITRERLTFSRDGDDLLIFVDAGAAPAIRVLNHFLGGNAAIDYVQPDGGFYLTTTEINQIVAGGGTGGEYDQVIEGTASAEQLVGGNGKDLIKGLGGNDQLFGMSGNDTLQGGDGDDYLAGGNGSATGSGNDRLEGGAGADTLAGQDGTNALIGGGGNDSYVYGGGQDTIDNTGGGYDGVFFNNGILADDLAFSREGDDLLITVDGNASATVRVTNHFLGGDYAIDFVQPASGSSLNTAAINALAEDDGGNPGSGGNEGNDDDYSNVVTGTGSGEQLLGTSGRDLIRGLGGNDTLFGFGGDDKFEGGDGDDYISGGNGSFSGSGNDILIGGNGNDTLVGEDGADMLIGGAGDDDYYYSAGSGSDTIDNVGGGTDWVFFNGIARERLSFHQDGDDLLIRVDASAASQVRVLGHFLGGGQAISYVQPGSGYAIPASQIPGLLTSLPQGFSAVSSGNASVSVAEGGGSADAMLVPGHGRATQSLPARTDSQVGIQRAAVIQEIPLVAADTGGRRAITGGTGQPALVDPPATTGGGLVPLLERWEHREMPWDGQLMVDVGWGEQWRHDTPVMHGDSSPDIGQLSGLISAMAGFASEGGAETLTMSRPEHRDTTMFAVQAL